MKEYKVNCVFCFLFNCIHQPGLTCQEVENGSNHQSDVQKKCKIYVLAMLTLNSAIKEQSAILNSILVHSVKKSQSEVIVAI